MYDVKALDYQEKMNMFDVIKNSPYSDVNGVKVIPLSTRFLKCFYRSIRNTRDKKVSSTQLNGLMEQFNKYSDSGVNIYRLKDTELTKEFKEALNVTYGNQIVVLCTDGTETKFDVESACRNIINYTKANPMNKYAVPYTKFGSLNVTEGGIYVYDFLNHFNYESIMNTEKFTKEDSRNINKLIGRKTLHTHKRFQKLVDKLIDESPMCDVNGNKFILLSTFYVRCFYKHISYSI